MRGVYILLYHSHGPIMSDFSDAMARLVINLSESARLEQEKLQIIAELLEESMQESLARVLLSDMIGK